MQGVPANRDRPATELTKLEHAAIAIFNATAFTHADAVREARALFDALEADRLHRLNHAEGEHE